MADTTEVRVLSNGVEMPVLGLGVWQTPRDQTAQAVAWALEAGYRHIDTATMYRNEDGVGEGLRAAGVSREQVFVTTKFPPGSDEPARELAASLDRLGLDYVDLYLIHWPSGEPTRFWAQFEQLYTQGLARAIGVSNYGAGQLEELTTNAEVAPTVNQVQFSPFQYRRGLLEACDRLGVALEAYSPILRGRNLDDPRITEIAERHQRTPAQILLRWGVQRGAIVIPKSRNRERIVANARIFDFELTHDDLAALDALDGTGGTDEAR